MRLLFAGTPEFAAVALRAVVQAQHEVVSALTQPDRPVGRGLRSGVSAVKRAATAHGIPVQQPATLRDPALVEQLTRLRPDVMVVAAYGLIVPPAVLRIPRHGCLNIHASLLPRWRGAAPIQRAILAGDAETGITIMQMDEGLDTGGIVLQRALPISPADTAGSLHDSLARLGGELIVSALAAERVPKPQDDRFATYAAKIAKAETHIDWRLEARAIERQVRAFNPAPGAATAWHGLPLKIWSAAVTDGVTATPGTVRAANKEGIIVACGKDAIRITELQRAGGRRLGAAAFLAGSSLQPGDRLGD